MGDANETGEPRPESGLLEDERAELARLRRELATYRQDHAPVRRRWRSAMAVLLVIVGCVLLPLSVVGVWARNQVSDTDRYLANVTPLASDPGVQNAIADRVTAEIFGRLDLQATIDQTVDVLVARGVPAAAADRLRGLSGPLANAARGFVRDKVGEVVASNTFQQAWITANRVAHQQLVQALSGQSGGAVNVSEGTVSVDLGAFIMAAKQSLIDAGFTVAQRVPDLHPQFVLFSSRDLQQAQTGYRLLQRVGTVLPFVAVGLIVLGIYLARRHRRALVGAGLGVAASMLLLGVAIAIARSVYLDRVPESLLSTTTAASVFDTLVRFVRIGLRMILVLGLVVAAAGFFSGPSVTAVRTRHGVLTAIAWVRERGEKAGLRTGPVGGWVRANLKLLRVAVVAIAGLVFVFLDRPTAKDVLIMAVVVVAAIVVLELLARPADTGPHESMST